MWTLLTAASLLACIYLGSLCTHCKCQGKEHRTAGDESEEYELRATDKDEHEDFERWLHESISNGISRTPVRYQG